MKKLYTISLLVLCIVTTGCSDWLNVAPSNQVNEENLFSTGNGYRNALNGVYLDLGTSTLYGQNLSWGFMDLIAQYYSPVELNKERVYYQALNYKFEHTDVKSIISSIWSRSYNNIANCNNLINQVSKGWAVSRMPRADLCIIRLAYAEALILKSAPVEVILNEAIELAKDYGSHASPSFVNGVLVSIFTRSGWSQEGADRYNK